MTMLREINKQPVRNARKPLVVHVTDPDIRTAQTKNPMSCVFAKACKREGLVAKVHLSRVYIQHDGFWVRYLTPNALRQEIIAFDRGGRFEPGEFRLAPVTPKKASLAGKRQGTTPKYTNSRNNPQRKRRKQPTYVYVPGVRETATNTF